jgi:hypothetical protein
LNRSACGSRPCFADGSSCCRRNSANFVLDHARDDLVQTSESPTAHWPFRDISETILSVLVAISEYVKRFGANGSDLMVSATSVIDDVVQC